MTEEEAKTKWCFKANADAVPAERLPPGERDITKAHARCIGSACMAWRSRPQWRVRSDMPWQEGKNPKDGPNNQGREAGFCGLAGPP